MIIQTVMEIPNRLSIVFFFKKKVVPFSTVFFILAMCKICCKYHSDVLVVRCCGYVIIAVTPCSTTISYYWMKLYIIFLR